MARDEHLFQSGKFISHSGRELGWKIECDALTNEDWDTIVGLVTARFRFRWVYGVATGGWRFAKLLEPYESGLPSDPVLLVDDVLTTGTSMEWMNDFTGLKVIGVVLFARGHCPEWITPIFQLTLGWEIE